jgi:hypothetical protein
MTLLLAVLEILALFIAFSFLLVAGWCVYSIFFGWLPEKRRREAEQTAAGRYFGDSL